MHSTDSNTPRSWAVCLSRWWPLRRRACELSASGLRLLRPEQHWPRFVRGCATTLAVRHTLALLDWTQVPGPTQRRWFGTPPVPLAAYLGAFLVQLDLGLRTTAQLHRFLVAHPALVWALGFPLRPSGTLSGFDAAASLPTPRHFNRVLRQLPNAVLQGLLDSQVSQLGQLLPVGFGQTISLDTKAILAWVRAPCHGVLYRPLRKGCGQFATPARSPPLVVRETALRTKHRWKARKR